MGFSPGLRRPETSNLRPETCFQLPNFKSRTIQHRPSSARLLLVSVAATHFQFRGTYVHQLGNRIFSGF